MGPKHLLDRFYQGLVRLSRLGTGTVRLYSAVSKNL